MEAAFFLFKAASLEKVFADCAGAGAEKGVCRGRPGAGAGKKSLQLTSWC